MAEQYWITGADGNEYGPAPLETLRLWIQERRVVATTLVRRGEGPPLAAAELPELAAAFLAPAAAPSAPPIKLPAEFRVWDFIGQAWELVRPHWLPLGLIFLVYTAMGSVPYVGGCVHFIIGGALWVGIWRAITGMIDGRPPDVGMMFQGFDRFGEAFLLTLVSGVLVTLGLVALIVPGVILLVMWMFSIAFVAETKLGFWEAMRASAELTKGYRWQLFLLGLANLLVLVMGVLALCVGLFVAYPVAVTAMALAFRFLKQRQAQPAA